MKINGATLLAAYLHAMSNQLRRDALPVLAGQAALTEGLCMRQTPSIVLIVIAAVLVVGVKVVAPKPGSLRSDFTAVKTAVPSGMKSFPNELLPQ